MFYGLDVGQLFEVQITFESNPAPDQVPVLSKKYKFLANLVKYLMLS